MMRLSADELRRVKDLEIAGRMTQDDVVAEARNPDSPLHARFNWNDADAAHERRLQIAGEIIRTVTIHVKTERYVIEAPAYVHYSPFGNARGYMQTETASQDPNAVHAVLLDELSRVLGMAERAERVALGLGVEGMFDTIVSEARKARMRLTAAPIAEAVAAD